MAFPAGPGCPRPSIALQNRGPKHHSFILDSCWIAMVCALAVAHDNDMSDWICRSISRQSLSFVHRFDTPMELFINTLLLHIMETLFKYKIIS